MSRLVLSRSALPNALTILRLLLVGPVLVSIMAGWTVMAAVLFLLAGITDALDGALARRLNARTALGATLDPVADKALLSGTFVVLALEQVLPIWLALLVVGRDTAILAGAVVVRVVGGVYAPRPTRLSRVNTALQVGLLALVLAIMAMAPGLTGPAVAWLAPVVALTTVASGLEYAWTAFGRRDRRAAGLAGRNGSDGETRQ